jgi:hypothetical protein
MTCRDSALSSVMITFARDMSGLEDSQVLGLYHELMREHEASDTETSPEQLQFQQNRVLEAIETRHANGDLQLSGQSQSPARRLRRAADETPDAGRLHAANRIVSRAQRAAHAHDAYLQQYSTTLGTNVESATFEFWHHFHAASASSNMQPSEGFRRSWLGNAAHTHLPVDRRTLYAYEQMEVTRAMSEMAAETTRPAVQRRVVPPEESTAIAEIGYDPLGGRLEIVMRSSDRVYAYRMTPEEWSEMENSGSLGRYYTSHVRGSADHRYANADEAAAASVHHQCATCGQFVALAGHHCPPHGSEESLERDMRAAVERARRNAAGPNAPVVGVEPHDLPSSRTRRYGSGEGLLTVPTISGLRNNARQHVLVSVPVTATYPNAAADNSVASVTGRVLVEFNGNGAGYAVMTDNDTTNSHNQLQCTCDEYRANYRCPHINATVADLGGLLSGDEPLRGIADNVTDDVAALSAAADADVAAARAGYQPRVASFADNPELFQEEYAAARQRREAYREAQNDGTVSTVDYPVPYDRSAGALGGLCTRESGRGFGVELEYSFPYDMSYDDIIAANHRIGQELYDLGLTDTTRQKEYGATHGRPPVFQHARGWSFEEDPSTSGGNFRQGGEIVSPVCFDEAETWTNLEAVCEVIRRHGGTASSNAGAHVHVGAGEYDHTISNHNRLLANYSQYEDLLWRLSTNPDSRNHRPSYPYNAPNHIPSSPYTTVSAAQREHSGHDLALNLASMDGSAQKDNVEWRMMDSSLRPEVLQAQILIAASVTAAASRETGNPRPNQNRTPVGTALRANPDRTALTGERWHAQTQSVREFIDRFIPGGTDDGATRARQIVSLFAMNRWQRDNR